ncbi:hypothetical protein HMN09_01029100 [Mycena chlorophos]|uniref:Uncharacterized protein n=1 Tax=Mycena chlorophos TaxID=658473 RepID=A0A8H6SEM5_MYCCL|nr:hypothetical protein HMN09_01029100 [Mycena chlorophos]
MIARKRRGAFLYPSRGTTWLPLLSPSRPPLRHLRWKLRSQQESANTHPTAAAADCLMSDIHDDPRPNSPSYQGCEFLQAIQSQLDFPTTGGAYIDTILTHRQIFYAYPRGHQCCSRAFSDFACALQQREWRADRDSDVEAAAAFNYEAQVIASVFP